MNKPALQHWFRKIHKWVKCQRKEHFTVILDSWPHNEVQGQIVEVAAYEINLHEQNVQHADNHHKSEVIGGSLTFTATFVESESEEGRDGLVLDSDETTASFLFVKSTTVMMVTPWQRCKLRNR